MNLETPRKSASFSDIWKRLSRKGSSSSSSSTSQGFSPLPEISQAELDTIRSYKIVILGDEGVGKTSLVAQYINNYFPKDHEPTIEDVYSRNITIFNPFLIEDCSKNIQCEIEIVDTSGRHIELLVSNEQIENADAFLLVFSLTDAQSYKHLSHFYEHIRKLRNGEIPLWNVVCNKCDIADEGDRTDVPSDIAQIIAMAHDCFFTSAATRLGVEECFYSIISALVQKHHVAKIEEKFLDAGDRIIKSRRPANNNDVSLKADRRRVTMRK